MNNDKKHVYNNNFVCSWFLNQMRAGLRLAHARFLIIASVWTFVCVHACPPPRLLVTSGMIWTPYDWLNKGYSFYMAAVVIINSGCGLRIEVHCRNQPNKSKLSLYKPFLSL